MKEEIQKEKSYLKKNLREKTFCSYSLKLKRLKGKKKNLLFVDTINNIIIIYRTQL
jgi:hypothetical protein